jgi:hypothetical protein
MTNFDRGCPLNLQRAWQKMDRQVMLRAHHAGPYRAGSQVDLDLLYHFETIAQFHILEPKNFCMNRGIVFLAKVGG